MIVLTSTGTSFLVCIINNLKQTFEKIISLLVITNHIFFFEMLHKVNTFSIDFVLFY